MAVWNQEHILSPLTIPAKRETLRPSIIDQFQRTPMSSVFQVPSLDIITFAREKPWLIKTVSCCQAMSGNDGGRHKHKQLKQTTTTKKIPLFLSYKTCSLVGKRNHMNKYKITAVHVMRTSTWRPQQEEWFIPEVQGKMIAEFTSEGGRLEIILDSENNMFKVQKGALLTERPTIRLVWLGRA